VPWVGLRVGLRILKHVMVLGYWGLGWDSFQVIVVIS